MSFPWPSFGTFVFKRDETELWGSDQGWALSPSYAQMRPIGSTKDHIVATAIGSASRSFECYLEPSRFLSLQAKINTVDDFTDWERPTPDSRQAMLMEVVPVEKTFHRDRTGLTKPVIRTRVTLLSQ